MGFKIELMFPNNAYSMKTYSKIKKWGNGLAIRVSGVMRNIPQLKEGAPIEVLIFEDRLEIGKSQSVKRLMLPFTEAELLNGMTAKTAYADILANPIEEEY